MIDLHIHSNYSDGTLDIKDILSEAKHNGLSQISITDHNILTGSIEASKLSDIDFIIGTELSVDYKGNEVHLLAYFPSPSDYKHTQFVINEGEAYKRVAILEMIERLNKGGFDIKLNELTKFSKGIINRVHICMSLMEHGYIKSISEGFDKYVGDDCPYYVQRKAVTLIDAAEAIHLDGGIAIIAHPYEYVDFTNVDTLFDDIINVIDGIECFHPSAAIDESNHLLDIAAKNNKLVTGGSDFHGNNKPNITMNMMKVDDKYRIHH